ncbi:MAG: glycosyltransferase family 4 protein [Candidatus Krumholzibacteria bacterium]|nr:glycosyltransferase family 4 protein [Candidatus Krumholzibacteria bacterium]
MAVDRSEDNRGSVCIVRHSFYPYELNVKREAEALLEDGFEVHVICLRGDNEAAHEVVEGVEVHRLPVGHRRGRVGRYVFEYTAFFLLASFKLVALDLKNRFRVIQVNTMPDYLVFTTLVPRLAGARVLIHMHEPMPELFETMFDRWYGGLFVGAIRLAEKLSLKYADRVLTVTREMRDNFGSRGADVNKITVIVNVPDDRVFGLERYAHLSENVEAVRKRERRSGKFRVLCHGAIERRYGIDLVVRAVARLKESIPGVEFRFMGQGDYLSEVQKLAEELDVTDHVTYLGFVPFETMVEEILAANVTVVPVQKNPYSVLVHTNKMYEYVALRKPVVASRLDSVAAYFPEDSLVFFEPGNEEDLADKLRYVFAHPEEMAARVALATEIYETYRWDREKKKYLGVYHSLLSQS